MYTLNLYYKYPAEIAEALNKFCYDSYEKYGINGINHQVINIYNKTFHFKKKITKNSYQWMLPNAIKAFETRSPTIETIYIIENHLMIGSIENTPR